MRKFKLNDKEYNCIEHIILKNFWEYYILDVPTNDGEVKFAYVMGDYPEFGDVYLPELKQYIISKTADLYEILPPNGGQWVS